MKKKLSLWWRKRQFQKAYMILRKEADQHKAANHIMDFEAANEAYVMLRCTACPDLHPYKGKNNT